MPYIAISLVKSHLQSKLNHLIRLNTLLKDEWGNGFKPFRMKDSMMQSMTTAYVFFFCFFAFPFEPYLCT